MTGILDNERLRVSPEVPETQAPSVFAAAVAHKWLVIGITLVFAIAALLYSLGLPLQFEAATTVVIDERDPAEAVGLGSSVDENRLVRNQLQVFRSASVAREAVEIAAGNGFEVSLTEVIEGVTFANLIDSDVITITFLHEDPATAEAVVSAIVDGYREVRTEQNQSEGRAGLARLEAAAEVLLLQLADIDSEISQLRTPRGITTQVAALLDQISILSDQARQSTGGQRDELLQELSALSGQLSALQFALQVEGEVPAIASLLRQQQNLVDQLANLAARRTEMEIGADALDTGISFVAEPSSTQVGGSTGKLFTALAGAFLGFLVAEGVALSLSSRRRFFTDRLEPQRLLGIPFLADIPKFSTDSDLPVRDHPRSPEAESFRFVAANLDLLLQRIEAKSVLVVSKSVGDGKSTVVANTAVACARAGQRVLVIDADFGNQAVTQLFVGNAASRPGLTELLAGRAVAQDVISPLSLLNGAKVDLLSRGQERIVATNVFGDKRTEDVLASLTAGYDIVFIDGPPIMQVAYASFVARLADAILTVIAAESDVESAFELKGRLSFLDIPLLGYVYNKAQLRSDMADSGGSMKDVLGDLGMAEAVPERIRR